MSREFYSHRPKQVDEDTFASNWERTFPKEHPVDRRATSPSIGSPVGVPGPADEPSKEKGAHESLRLSSGGNRTLQRAMELAALDRQLTPEEWAELDDDCV